MVRASSIIEVIVASLIFMLVFALSLTTLTRLTLRQDEAVLLIEAEKELNKTLKIRENQPIGTYIDTFDWGSISTIISDYEKFENIRQIHLRATLTNSRKSLEIRRLVAGMDAE